MNEFEDVEELERLRRENARLKDEVYLLNLLTAPGGVSGPALAEVADRISLRNQVLSIENERLKAELSSLRHELENLEDGINML
jgi:cell division protein FtsB